MDKCPTHFDNKEGGFYICAICECPLKTHCFFVHCPLLENEIICLDCCQTAGEEKIIETLKELGKEYTREEVDKICKGCGYRCVGERVEE